MVLDNERRVQGAGCSCFAALGDAGPELAPYLEPEPRNPVFTFNNYRHDMRILYNAVGTLADAPG